MESTLTKQSDQVIIRTPDQRLRVFISSTIQELSSEREIVRRSIEQLQLIPVLFELGARPHPPRELYRAYLFQSHIFIGIYWESYGWVAPGGAISGLEDEYQLATGMPKLIYIKKPSPGREQALAAFLERVQEENCASYKYFSSPEQLGELIAKDLALLLSERFESSLPGNPIASQQAILTGSNIPRELTPLIGRGKLVESVSNLLEKKNGGLITLTGSGGVGKTRLALRIASRQIGQLPDGVWFVELASQSEKSGVIQSIADVLSIREQANRTLLKTLIDHLYDKSLLLVLDNCEHLVKEVAGLAETLLQGAPGVRILATSREALGVPGEVTRYVPPLSAPEMNEEIEIGRLGHYEAVKLFIERGMTIDPEFTITEQNAAAVAQICARLDGIPLAIELAAARLRVLPVGEIAARIDDRFHLLIGNRNALPRQQTLRALIDWSYDLLNDSERMLLRRLSVFAGSWTLEAAEQVCSDEGIETVEILELLTHLIDKSLVIPILQGDQWRYQFLNTIHQFCSERLQESGEFDQFAYKHADYYYKLAEGAHNELWSSNQDYWLRTFASEHDNLRLSLETLSSMGNREKLVLLMARSLWRFWEIRGHISEGRRWLERALVVTPDADQKLRADALRGAGILACHQGDYAQSILMHEQSLEIYRAINLKLGIGRQLDALGEIAWFQGDYPKALELHTESLAIRFEIKDQEGIAVSLEHLGKIARDRGNYRYASELLEESLERYRKLGIELYIARSLNNLGNVAHRQCDYVRAKTLFKEALSVYLRLDDKLGTSSTMQNLGNIAKDQGEFSRAKQLYYECLAQSTEITDKHGIARSIASLAEVAFFQGNYSEAAEFAEKSLSLFNALGVIGGTILSMQILAFVAHYQGNYEAALSLAEESHDLSSEIKSPRQIAYAKGVLGLNDYARGKLEDGREHFHDALKIFREVNDRRNVAHTLVNLARIAYRQGDYGSSMEYLDESLLISRSLGINWSLAFSLEIKGLILRNMGERKEAYDLFLESLDISVEQMNLQGIDNCLGALAGLAVEARQLERAARMFAFTGRVREEVGVMLGRDDQQEYDRFLGILREQLDDAELESAWSSGNSMTLKETLKELEEWKDSLPFQ